MLDGDKVLSPVHTLWMMPEVPGGKQTSMETCLLPESKYWTELIAVMEELMVLESWLEDINAVSSETQDKVVGSHLTAEEEETLLRLLVDQDNISTSVVSESGLEQIDQNQEFTQEEKLDGDLPDRALLMVTGVQIVQSEQVDGEIPSEEIKILLHANIPGMMLVEHGGLVISKVLIMSD